MSNPLRTAILLAASASLWAQTAPSKPPASTPAIKITILGSGGGPPVNLQQYGPSILIEAAGEKLLFDCGRGMSFRLAEAGIRLGQVDKLFLTHLHSDHIVSISDLLLTGWGSGGRLKPLQVWGPAGTRNMMDKLQEAFVFDIHTRRDVDEHFSKEGITVVSTDIKEGVVYDKAGLKVSAFLVDHGPVKPAFGYRVEYAGHSVAMSGDTRFSENLIQHAQGVDVLIHETIGVEASQRARLAGQGFSPEQVTSVINHHTSAAETAIVFNRVKPRLAVYAHGGDAATAAETRQTYAGPLEVGEDLMTIEIGDKIDVHRRAR